MNILIAKKPDLFFLRFLLAIVELAFIPLFFTLDNDVDGLSQVLSLRYIPITVIYFAPVFLVSMFLFNWSIKSEHWIYAFTGSFIFGNILGLTLAVAILTWVV